MLKIFAVLFASAFTSLSALGEEVYQLGSQISKQAVVTNAAGEPIVLQDLIADADARVTVLFIFGGGGMGYPRSAKIGGLWCPDSFEDLHILRTLHNHYKDKVAIIPVAVPPVFHSEELGYEKDLFLQQRSSDDYQEAMRLFIDSTQKSFEQGTIPVQPYFDSGFNLLISQVSQEARSKVIPEQEWHGAFRAVDETQHYGVPNLWVLDSTGKVVAEPFRGNIYRPHGDDITIKYSLADVVSAIEAQLN